MALKRWRWLVGPVVAAALVAIVILPPGVPTRPVSLFGLGSWAVWYPDYFGADTGRSQFRADVQAARSEQRTRLLHATLADSIVAVARGPRAFHSRDGLVSVVYEAPLTPDSARFWLEAVTHELDLYPRGPTAGMPLVVALLSSPVRADPANRATFEWGVWELLDQTASTGTCVVTVNLLTRSWGRLAVGRDLDRRPVSHLLGACALYARFGAPGGGVARWMETAWRRYYYWGDPLTTQLQEARRRVLPNRTLGDLDWLWYSDVRWLVGGCLSGAESLCVRAAGLDPEPGSPFLYRLLPRSQIVAYLLATGTAQQFAAFWHSSERPAAAMAAAFGEPAARLSASAIRHWYTLPASARPWGNARDELAGLAWLVLALLVAVAAGRRWKVEP